MGEGGREGGREGRREGGREGGKEGGREGGREELKASAYYQVLSVHYVRPRCQGH